MGAADLWQVRSGEVIALLVRAAGGVTRASFGPRNVAAGRLSRARPGFYCAYSWIQLPALSAARTLRRWAVNAGSWSVAVVWSTSRSMDQ